MTTSIELFKPDAMNFAKDGALRLRAALDASDLRRLEDAVANLPPDQAGIRLYGIPALRPFLASPGAIWKVAASVLGEAARPVRAILFDKTPSTNWDCPGTRIERSWSPGGWRSRALARGPSRAGCFTWRHRLICWLVW
jgi:hypothetical protein